MVDDNSRTKLVVLALGSPTSAAYTSIMHGLRALGTVTFWNEGEGKKAADVLSVVSDRGVDLVVMPNPYGNLRRLNCFRILKEYNVPVLCFDRGGLPDSWFFDVGFNADSETYDIQNWDMPLTPEESVDVHDYINQVRGKATPLESQGDRIGGKALRESLGISKDKKVLFVPFQRPADTTIKYFGGREKAYEAFIKVVSETTLLMSERDDWLVVCKKHPLEVSRPAPGLNFVDDDTHVNDLLEMCDAVALVNSGVGLLAAVSTSSLSLR